MKALVKSRSAPGLWLEDVEEPSVGVNDVLVRVQRTGICGTDLHISDWDTGACDLRDRVTANAGRFRELMSRAVFEVLGAAHPIVPIMYGEAEAATNAAEGLLARGVHVVPFSFPVVPRGQARIRAQLSAAHTYGGVDRAVAAFTAVRDELEGAPA